jgi:DNA polymerase/3'-5' exonuclease PolX
MLTMLIDFTVKKKATSTKKAQEQQRINSFVKARDAISGFNKPVTSGAMAQRDIDGVGKGIATRIDEFLRTGTLVELQGAVSVEEQIISELTTVEGIGEANAQRLINDYKITGLADLKARYKSGTMKVGKNQLTNSMAVGLDYYDDIKQRMSWSEAHDITKEILILLAGIPSSVQFCGSYRRKRPTCGDLDVLISYDGDDKSYLKCIVKMLDPILVGHLTVDGTTKYMGVCKLHPSLPGHRIDIRLVPSTCLGAAMLYFTGSCKFNKLMRYFANQRGYTLNEYGLYTYINGLKGALVPAQTEEDIFQILNLLYLSPTEREF